MAYLPIKNDRSSLEATPETKESDLGDGSDTDVESDQVDTYESTSFVKRWCRAGIPWPSSNRSQRRTRDDAAIAPLISSLIPWVINLILAVTLVSLSWKKGDTTPSRSHLPPTDLLWSKVPACTPGFCPVMFI